MPDSVKLETPEHRYTSFNHGIYACEYHIIWCTKYRRQVLTSTIQSRIKEVILEQQEAYGYRIRAMEVMPDHLHLLMPVPPNVAVTLAGYRQNQGIHLESHS